MKIKRLIYLCLLVVTLSSEANAVCTPGLPMDPVTDVCFECVFPFKVSGIPMVPGTWINDLPVPTDIPICACPVPPPVFIRIGVPLSFWNPSRYTEAVKDPFCFPGLGIGLTAGATPFLGGGADDKKDLTLSKWQAHYFIFPVFEMLELMKDVTCLQIEGLDIAELSEIDPLWQSDLLSILAFPETILFAIPIAPLACIVDGVSTTIGYSTSPLYWCVGGSGTTYPMTGNVSTESMLEGASTAAARATYVMARLGVLWDTAINPCMAMPTFVWIKHNFRVQAAKPIRSISCNPFGTTSFLWGAGVNIPFKENFAFINFKRVACCAW